MTFAQIEQIIGGPLPRSKQHPAWWLVFRRKEAKVSRPVSERPAEPDGEFLERLRKRLGGAVTFAPDLDLTAPVAEDWEPYV